MEEDKRIEFEDQIGLVERVSLLLEEGDYTTALFALENFPHGSPDLSPLYARVAVSIARELDRMGNVGADQSSPMARPLVEELLKYAKHRCRYFSWS